MGSYKTWTGLWTGFWTGLWNACELSFKLVKMQVEMLKTALETALSSLSWPGPAAVQCLRFLSLYVRSYHPDVDTKLRLMLVL